MVIQSEIKNPIDESCTHNYLVRNRISVYEDVGLFSNFISTTSYPNLFSYPTIDAVVVWNGFVFCINYGYWHKPLHYSTWCCPLTTMPDKKLTADWTNCAYSTRRPRILPVNFRVRRIKNTFVFYTREFTPRASEPSSVTIHV